MRAMSRAPVGAEGLAAVLVGSGSSGGPTVTVPEAVRFCSESGVYS